MLGVGGGDAHPIAGEEGDGSLRDQTVAGVKVRERLTRQGDAAGNHGIGF
jgi:hypothetical protein